MNLQPSLRQDQDPLIKIRDLSVAYRVRGGEVMAVEDVSFSLLERDTCGIVGESGCGKSTVAWAIVNFLGANGKIKRGSIAFQGIDLTQRSSEELRRLRGSKISMVFQDPMQSLNPSMRIGQQMKEVLTVHSRLSSQEAARRCVQMLEKVHMPDPEDVMHRYPHQLSGGQQQRVVIATALLNHPALLILDEPTTALDVTVEAAVLDLVEELRQEFDMSIILITHNLGVVARVCSKVGVMYAGEMVEFSTIKELFKKPLHPYTQGLLRCVPRLGNDKHSNQLHPIPGRVPSPGHRPEGCIFWPRCSYAGDRCRSEHPVLRQAAGGERWVRCHLFEEIDPFQWRPEETLPAASGTDSQDALKEPILEAIHLGTHYPVPGNAFSDLFGIGQRHHVRALDDASFRLPKRQTLGIVGESGCGKSTLLKTLIGLEKRTEGAARFLGFDISGPISSREASLIREMQMVFQNPDSTMNPCYTVGHQIGRPMRKFRTVPRNRIHTEVIKLLKAMRLSENYYDRLPGQLSGGEKQRVGIARAMACHPDLILCDEPVSALDVSVQAAILNLLMDLQEEFETTLIFISHDLSVVRFISDYICVMYLGKIVETGRTEAIYRPPYHPYTEALLSAVPVPDPEIVQGRIRLQGVVPSAINPPEGCRFHTRCPRRSLLADPRVCLTDPPWQEGDQGHRICCHIPLEELRHLPPVLEDREQN
jgi:peptide/nickel transport system ATP-binding protein